jgi:hypothetical protein
MQGILSRANTHCGGSAQARVKKQRRWWRSDELTAPVVSGVLHWGGKQRADTGITTYKENKTRGVLRASLTVEIVSAAKANRNLVRWCLLRDPKLDKRQQGDERLLTPHRNVQWHGARKSSPAGDSTWRLPAQKGRGW